MFSLDRDQDTICAVSTAAGYGAIAIVRVSGPKALEYARKVAPFLPENPTSHCVYYGFFQSFSAANNLDEVLATYFVEGRSFTGEETIEFSCHGSPVITQLILENLISAGCRLAQKGEFTYRAFMHGRIDLPQAESVLMMIESQSKHAATLALRQLQGELSEKYNQIKRDLLWILSRLEANIDFASEDIEFAPSEEIQKRISAAHDLSLSLVDSFSVGRSTREGLRVVLVGPPNVGKSSLLNALTRRDRSIVSEIAGTTRDVVEASFEIHGHRVDLVDTAGLHVTDDRIELLGIQKTQEEVRSADLVLFVHDATTYSSPREAQKLIPFDVTAKMIHVVNKADLVEGRGACGKDEVFCSATTQEGLNELRGRLVDFFKLDHRDQTPVMVSRQYELLKQIEKLIGRAKEQFALQASPEFLISDLNEALEKCFELVGEKYDDQILDQVFRDFCLGK